MISDCPPVCLWMRNQASEGKQADEKEGERTHALNQPSNIGTNRSFPLIMPVAQPPTVNKPM